MKVALYGSQTADDYGKVLPDILECGGSLNLSPYRNPQYPTEPQGSLGGTRPPPLWIRRRIRFLHQRCNREKAPSPRRVWNLVPMFPADALVSPVTGVRQNRTALPAHSKTVQNP